MKKREEKHTQRNQETKEKEEDRQTDIQRKREREREKAKGTSTVNTLQIFFLQTFGAGCEREGEINFLNWMQKRRNVALAGEKSYFIQIKM